jgi:PTH1 family peptidyl-tRNA hydrolase
LVVGLGNIGPEYEYTRHNIGFQVLEAFGENAGITFETSRYALFSYTRIKNKELHLIKPTTLVNLSGKAVRYWLDELQIPLSRLLVITDDVDLPLGKLKLKKKGGDAGHNGMKHIIELLQTKEFPRLRMGIGKNYPKGRQVPYVLGEWTEEEWKSLSPQFQKANDIIKNWVLQGIDKTMTQYNS